MPKVIETNLYIEKDEIKDFQSRIIEVDSWEDFINEVREGKTVIRNSILGNLHGSTIPRAFKVINLEYDDFHLSCDVYNYLRQRTKKLVYLIE